jgi:hypothetical protein
MRLDFYSVTTNGESQLKPYEKLQSLAMKDASEGAIWRNISMPAVSEGGGPLDLVALH